MSTFRAFRTAVISTLKTSNSVRQALPRASKYTITTKPPSLNSPFAQKKFHPNTDSAVAIPEKGKSQKIIGPLKDEDIPYPKVQISHGGRLSIPVTVARVLSLVDRRGYYIQLVSHQPPVVKIVNKSDEYIRKKKDHEQAKLSRAKRARKEVQLSWGTSDADAAHKLEKARDELKKGNRVDLVFALKKGHPIPSEGEMRERLQSVISSLEDVSKEWKERELQRKVAAVFLQGIVQAQSNLHQEEMGAHTAVEAASSVIKKGRARNVMEIDTATKKKKYNVNPISQELWDLFK